MSVEVLEPWINTPTGYLGGGDAHINGDDPGWRQEDGKRVFEHEFALQTERPATLTIGVFDGSYKAARPPRIITAISMLDADGHVNYSVEMRHPWSYARNEPIRGSRYILTIAVWGPGRLNEIGVSWTAIAMCQLWSGG